MVISIKYKIMAGSFAAIAVLLTVFIFYNSSKDNAASHKDSHTIVDIVEPIVQEIVGGHTEKTDFWVRKGAHLVEFCLLGMAVLACLTVIKWRYAKTFYGFAGLYVLAVAVLDEFIQSFSDRTSSVGDVLLDFSGAVIGFLLIILGETLLWLWRKRYTVHRVTE